MGAITNQHNKELIMTRTAGDFHQFQLAGWQRIAHRYDQAWSGLVRPFIPFLLEAATVEKGARLLDVACGPGYVGEAAHALGAIPTGVDFSAEMIRMAKDRNPLLEFHVGDAQALDFMGKTFDRVVMNFGLLHLSRPENAFSEACRVIRPGGWYGFTIWAGPEKSLGNRIVTEAIKAHANFDIQLPPGPAYFSYGNPEECGHALGEAGFDPSSLTFRTETIEWKVPSASFLFDAERDAGVRNAGILALQTPEALMAIKGRIEASVRAYERGDGFVIPFTAHIVAARAL